MSIRIHEWIRARADSESDALSCVEENEFELDDSDELGELAVGEESEGTLFIEIKEVKDDY